MKVQWLGVEKNMSSGAKMWHGDFYKLSAYASAYSQQNVQASKEKIKTSSVDKILY
jgi:hypothetical protein